MCEGEGLVTFSFFCSCYNTSLWAVNFFRKRSLLAGDSFKSLTRTTSTLDYVTTRLAVFVIICVYSSNSVAVLMSMGLEAVEELFYRFAGLPTFRAAIG
jgi:hypothetical protein